MKPNENITLKTTSDLTAFLYALDRADSAETERFNETEKALGLLKALRTQYKSLQHGNAKKLNPGELPSAIYVPVIKGLYESKESAAKTKGEEFTLKFENFRDFQVRSLKFYLETGELFNRKKDTLQERAMIAIDKLEKKLAADKAKAEKLKAEQVKAEAEAKAKAEAEAKVKAEAEEIIDDVHTLMDNDPQGADAIKDELFDIIDDAEASIAEAELEKIEAAKAADKAEAEAAKAADKAEATKTKLNNAKNKLANLSRGSRGKADNNESNPDLSKATFSQDCKTRMTELLDDLESEFSEAELLCLAGLIRARFTSSKA